MKDFRSRYAALIATLILGQATAQNTIFSENMGTTGATGNPVITAFSGWQNAGCSYTYSGNGNVSTANSSSGAYTGASGGNNVLVSSGSTVRLIINGINTQGYSALTLSYGLYNSNILSGGNGFAVDVSTDGISYTSLTRPGTFWTVAGWLTETCSGTIPATTNLYIRFTNTAPFINFRIDDVKLTGTPTASSNPTAYNGWPAAYNFNSWPASNAPGTYPANMVFHYGALGVAQPVLSDITASYNYASSYSLTGTNPCISLISGQGSNGFSFVNRNPGNASSSGNLGEAVLALNTTCRSNLQVSWQAGTVASNGTVYQLRAQYRIGSTGAYTNLPNSTIGQIQYTSGTGTANFGPITLPTTCENQPLVQLRWAYYYAGSGSTTGDEIFLTNINVTSATYPYVGSVSNQGLCGGKTFGGVTFSTTTGATLNWSNSNTAIGLAASGSGNIPTFTTATIATPPDKVGVITTTASFGGCTNTAVSFSITVKGPQTSSQWTGAASNDWFDHSNWTNCACTSITSATIPAVSNPSVDPVIAGTFAGFVNNLQINSGGNLSVQSTQLINMYGNFTNNGTFNAQNGNIQLVGSAPQSIGGSAVTQFYNLTLSNSQGASLASAQQITGSLQLNNGTFSTNNQLTLAASAAGTGKIGPINSAADISGLVTVQQYAPAGSTGWALMGAPLTSALTMADWNDNFPISCQTCPDGWAGGFTSIYSYDETVAGSYSFAAKYIPITTISASINHKKGYWVFLGNGYPNTTAINFDVTGSVAKSSCLTCGSPITIPISKTNNTSTFDDGWNLISNPLPSPISWTALRAGNSNIDNALYVYNADLGGGTGAYATYINNVASTIVGGINDTIPICQGFYVHATNSTLLTASENIKVNANPTYLRTQSTTKPIARLVMNGPNNFNDMATFYFEQGATANFQTDYDAYKLIYDFAYPYIGSMSDSVLTAVNGLPALTASLSVPVKAITASADSFYFSLMTSDFPTNVCVNLYDAFTGSTTDLRNSTYACWLYDTTSTTRFTINFFTNPLAGNSSVAQPNCNVPGHITASAAGTGPWNYEWKQGATIVRTMLNRSAPDSLVGLNGGNYTVKINTVGQCDNYSNSFSLNSVINPTAGFTANGTTYLSQNGLVDFLNTSVDAQTYSWFFGDAWGASSSVNPSYTYTSGGIYTAMLVAQSITGCIDSVQQTITVVDDVTSLRSLGNSGSVLLLTHATSDYELQLNFEFTQTVTARLYNSNGQLLKTFEPGSIKNYKVPVSLDAYAPGVYQLRVNSGGSDQTTFKLIK